MLLSSRSTTTSTSGGYAHIILPDAGSASGYSSYKILITSLLAGIKIDELYTPDGTSVVASTDNSDVLTIAGTIDYKLSTKTVTNAGGTSSGGAVELTVDKQFILIEATDANRFYKLPSSPSDGEWVKIIADGSNTTDVAIVTTNTNQVADRAVSVRDSISYVAIGGTWLSFGGRTDN